MDVSEQLTRFGAWQPSGSSSSRGPTVADALIGSLGGHGAPEKVRHCNSEQALCLAGPWSPQERDDLVRLLLRC